MNVFGAYARYYDLLYKDKDYQGEVDYISARIRDYGPETKTCLELGCGTGRHAELLGQKGFSLVGVDQSEAMIMQARERCPNIEFHSADLRNVRLERTFDSVLALFHVVSYQTANDDLAQAFRTVDLHLNRGGIFVFDCWYGPAVLHQRPESRIKRLGDGDVRITRIAEPEMLTEKNMVQVNYEILIKDGNRCEELQETHSMRYLFQPEVELLLAQHHMKLLHAEEWMSGKSPGSDTWGVVYIAMAE